MSTSSPKSKRKQKLKRDRDALEQHKLNWHDNIDITDVRVPWLYEAHSVLLLFIVLAVILYCAFTIDGSWRLAVKLNIFFFIAVGCLIFPAGPFQRPHPIFWRFIFSVSLLYSFCLLVLVSLKPDQMRATLRTLLNDESIGYKLPERSYAMDCTLTFEALWSVSDRFLLAHFLGWLVKAAILRNRGLAWVLSVSWEFVELATKYFIPNFAECWWDQLILDVLLCNGLGIECGIYLGRHFGDYFNDEVNRDWFGKYDLKGILRHFKRFMIQFTPLSLNDMEWESFSSLSRYFQICFMIVCGLIMDLNAFLLKLFLYIPTEHPLNVYRLILFLFFFSISSKQYYLFIENKDCMKLGSQSWVCFVILILELAVSVKCAPDPFPPMPEINKWCLGIGGFLFVVFTYVMFRDVKHVKAD